ncbi:HNH endonuclease [Streptomyces europaeiscabiei]|uniref:HNH endonuclease n=1 Tax=Streptomyces europaeiscabiei TaxID=146819 RepID=UPI0038D3749C
MATLYQRARRVRVATYSRAEVFVRWGGQCCYCEAPADQLDHVRPVSHGGSDVASNVVPACATCNLSKSDKSLAQWAETFGA